MKYRPDIDGLRAVAVLSVIAFHIDQTLIPGGFIGVDVFFVISGYLISLHIMSEIRQGSFSISEFYRRRIKRIAPAMLVVLATTFIAAQVLLTPEDAEAVARSAAAAILSLANVYFWLFQDTSYFAANSNELPLLHLWSLGVEEQFYIVWPLILMLTYRLFTKASFGVAIIIVAALSFLFGQAYYDIDSMFVYYMLPARAGELLVGAFVAHIVCDNPQEKCSRNVTAIASGTGSLMLVGSLYFVRQDAVFPGFQAIPPTVATALLIYAGHYGDTLPTRLLRLKLMTLVGVLSYSAYLWHWPLLAFINYAELRISTTLGLAVFFTTFGLAWLTYKYVEQPMRMSALALPQIALRQYIYPSVIIFFALGISLKSDGMAFRWFTEDYEMKIAEARDETKPAYESDYVCQMQRIDLGSLDKSDCVLGAELASKPTAILWGDSNAAHYIGMLGAFAREGGFRFRNIQIGSCPPLSSDPADFVRSERRADCQYSNTVIWKNIEHYATVILAANWTGYAERSDRYLAATEETVKDLLSRGQRVIIIGKAPIVEGYNRKCREKAIAFHVIDCSTAPVAESALVSATNALLRQLAERHGGVQYFDANTYLCANGKCPIVDESGSPMYFDAQHLTLRSSWRLGEKIIRENGIPALFDRIR